MASLTRAGSTVLNGLQIDRGAFRKDIDKLAVGARKHMSMEAAAKGRIAVAK